MNIATFDLATHTGVALLFNDVRNTTVWNFSPKKNDLYGKRFYAFRQKLEALPAVDLVVFEDVQGHGRDGIYAAQIYGGFKALLTGFCEEKGIRYYGIHTGILKKGITGKGNATKEEMISAAMTYHGWWPTCWKTEKGVCRPDDNEADAFCLLALCQHTEDGLEIALPPKPEPLSKKPQKTKKVSC
jgi:hypothetical protein